MSYPSVRRELNSYEKGRRIILRVFLPDNSARNGTIAGFRRKFLFLLKMAQFPNRELKTHKKKKYKYTEL